ncbi:MAG: hypothetical protein ACFCUR_12785 [Rhodomicrobiaceae bacterium]
MKPAAIVLSLSVSFAVWSWADVAGAADEPPANAGVGQDVPAIEDAARSADGLNPGHADADAPADAKDADHKEGGGEDKADDTHAGADTPAGEVTDDPAQTAQADPRCYQPLVHHGGVKAVNAGAEGGDHADEPADVTHVAPASDAEHAPPPADPAAADAVPQDDAAGADMASQPPSADTGATQPYQLIRTLELMQDRIAAGNRTAHVGQRTLMADIEKKLLAMPDEVWQEPKNSRAAIIYALSGGNPQILETLLRLSPLPCVDDNLIKGLLAYSRGISEAAKTWLAEIDPRSLAPRSAAHLALAQAMLIAAEQPSKAIYYLDLARLLAPGTLLEEAALRRETVITALMEDFEKFEMLTSQYLRRFGDSVYAPEFTSRFAVAVATGRYAQDDAVLQGLLRTLDSLNSKEQRTAYLALAQAAVVRGQVNLTRTTTAKLTELAKDDPSLGMQAKLYQAAAELVTDKYDEAAAYLRTIDRRELSVRDRPLLEAALNLAVRLRMPPQVAGPVAGPPEVSAEQGKSVEFGLTDQIIEQARTVIGSADKLLDGELR